MSKTIPAIEFCDSIFDGTHDTPNPKDEGFPLVTSKHMTGSSLNLSDAYLIDITDYQNINKRSQVSQWDILFSMIGTVGEVYLEQNQDINYAIKNIGVFSCKDEKRAKWLFYYLKSPAAKKHIQRYLSGAVQKFLSLGALRDFPVLPFDESANDGINLIALIDKKIELNNKINTELEAMAKLIYDYWFVQFDFPDANGKPYKSSGGKMVYNEDLKREIPDGWSVRPLSEIEPNIVTGKTPSTTLAENFGGNIPFICIGDVRGNMHITKTDITLSEIGANSQANKYIPEGAICVTCIASPGLVGFATEKSQTNQQLNTIVCSQFENQYFLYFYLKDYFRFAKAKSGNTFANMNKGDFSEIKVINPENELLIKFSTYLKPTIDKILVNSKENNKLVELRDWLLPMLMNGQVTVKDS